MALLTDYFEQKQCCSLINGQETVGLNLEPISLVSPVNKQEWKVLLPVGADEVAEAIAYAHSAYRKWAGTPAPARGKVLRSIADLMIEHKDLLAKAITTEMGKPIKESHAEVLYSAGYFSWFAGEAERIYGTSIPSQFPYKHLKIVHEPIGVCGFITPWNFPLAMASRKIAPALAAGCSAIVKPSPETPFTLLLLAKICQIAGAPDGTLNIVVGPEKEIGNALLDSPLVRKISFTGSTQVGIYLYGRSASTLKKLTLELGGNAPLLVFDDAAINQAVAGTVAAKFRNAGQTCIAANRIFIQEGIYAPFMDAFTEAVMKLQVGDPFDEKTDISWAIHPSAQEKVKLHVEDALARGAEAVLMSERSCEPKILSGITPGMRISSEETFGPVAAIAKFKSVEEGIALANASEYGLAAYIFTSSMKRANEAVSRLEYGIIGVNDGAISTPQASFGGMKYSGFGREGGPTGIYEYLIDKYISIATF